MLSTSKIRDASGWTIFIFGILALLSGLIGLLRPELLLTILGLSVLPREIRSAGDYTLIFLIASAMASFNIGVYYILAALNNLKPFYNWTVYFRMLTFIVFTTSVMTGMAPGRFLAVGIWELTGALATGFALQAENKS